MALTPRWVNYIAQEISGVMNLGVQWPSWWGREHSGGVHSSAKGMDRVSTAITMGMLAHRDPTPWPPGCPGAVGVQTRVQTAIEMRQVAEPL